MPRPWTVLDNSPLQKLEDNLWAVEGSVPTMPLRRRMTLVRLGDGSIVVHNAICLQEDEQRAIDAWGTIRYIVVPNPWHRLDAPAYQARYPEAKLVCPRPARKRLATIARVDGTLEDLPSDPALEAEPLTGSRIREHALIVRSGERITLVFGDTVMNNPRLPGVKGWAYRMLGSTSSGPNGRPLVTPLIQFVSVVDKPGLSAHLGRLAVKSGLVRVIPGHGLLVEGADAAPAMLAEAAASV